MAARRETLAGASGKTVELCKVCVSLPIPLDFRRRQSDQGIGDCRESLREEREGGEDSSESSERSAAMVSEGAARKIERRGVRVPQRGRSVYTVRLWGHERDMVLKFFWRKS